MIDHSRVAPLLPAAIAEFTTAKARSISITRQWKYAAIWR
jgi:hypothetical protein